MSDYENSGTAVLGEERPGSQAGGNDLESLLARINQLAGGNAEGAAAEPAAGGADPASAQTPAARAASMVAPIALTETEDGEWKPLEPPTLESAGVSPGQLEHLALKTLAACGDLCGRDLADQHATPFRLTEPVLQGLKDAQLVAFRGSAPMNDYIYQLTDMGRERAKKLADICRYFGAAPVTLEQYINGVTMQTIADLHPTHDDLKRAFSDLLVNSEMLRRLGPAVNSGRGLFLFGAPGNGKTSIAERVTAAYGDCIWIPRAIGIDGEVMRVFDPGLHEEAPLDGPKGPLQDEAIDQRWVRVRRPTIVVGGELTMKELEVQPGIGANVSEASLQMKSNCGVLVIDDFGRQRMTTDELLNRWIVPLEKRYDFLQCANGKKIQVPFDQLIIFSTNLEPKDLVDDAFLRRIPYKIEVGDPSEEEFRKLFEIMAPIVGMTFVPEIVDYLIETHYKPINRPYRCCQPRDLLQQVANYCHYINQPRMMTQEYIDFAVENYFAIM
ncbi:AAA family ATPase [Pirellulales bacterium]|nr:AAA family ATPase [Pirellulales bacterium]